MVEELEQEYAALRDKCTIFRSIFDARAQRLSESRSKPPIQAWSIRKSQQVAKTPCRLAAVN